MTVRFPSAHMTRSGNIASFSSRGPVSIDGSNRLKPDLTAPGVNVMSTIPSGYTFLSGTSMSSPHVAGAVALLWSVAPELVGDIDRTEQILRDSATPVINGDCDPAPATPNNVYGYGRLNVMQAILDARPPATATIVLVGAGSPPIAALPVRLVSDQTGFAYTATTGADGKVQVAFDHAAANHCCPEITRCRCRSASALWKPGKSRWRRTRKRRSRLLRRLPSVAIFRCLSEYNRNRTRTIAEMSAHKPIHTILVPGWLDNVRTLGRLRTFLELAGTQGHHLLAAAQ